MTDQEIADLKRFKGLIDMCGALQNDSFSFVTIGADDATRTWHVHVDKRHYWGNSIKEAIDKAIEAEL